MPGRHRAPTRPLLSELMGLLVPVECAGCGRWDVPLCEDCGALLAAPPRRCEQAAAGLDLAAWSVGAYAGPLRRIVLAWKTHRRTDVAPAVLAAGRRTGRALAPALAAPLAAAGAAELLVVPAPSGWRRRLARRLVARDLAEAVAPGLAAGLRARGGHDVDRVVVADVLRRRGGRTHQAGLGARRRAGNRRAGVLARAPVPPGAAVLLVDDVLTTGATLRACARAVGQDLVLGAVVLAHAPASSLPPPDTGTALPPRAAVSH